MVWAWHSSGYLRVIGRFYGDVPLSISRPEIGRHIVWFGKEGWSCLGHLHASATPRPHHQLVTLEGLQLSRCSAPTTGNFGLDLFSPNLHDTFKAEHVAKAAFDGIIQLVLETKLSRDYNFRRNLEVS